MARLGIIAILIGLLLTDPVLCRSVDAQGPCRNQQPSDACPGSGHSPFPEHGQQPSDACPGSGHGCVCQGATNTLSSRQHVELVLSAWMMPLLLGPWPDRLMDQAPPPFVLSPPRDADGPPIGRSLRIAHQSFQI